MLGKYDIEVYNNRVHYFLTIERNITILQGNSATGKTELIRLIQTYALNGASSGITLKCDAKCYVLNGLEWSVILPTLKGYIIFIDEDMVFTRSQQFAEAVRNSDNYFVIVTRDALKQLPYSVDEIYGLRNVSDAQKYKRFRRTYNEMYRLYNFKGNGLNGQDQSFKPDVVITEDSNSGYEFFNLYYQGSCESANGKSNIYEQIRKAKGKKILAIVDGAAFGCEIGSVLSYLETSNADCVLYAPESFEFLILSAAIVDVPNDVIWETYRYADSMKYLSWEEFYTDFLTDITRNTVFQYSKARLGNPYKTQGTLEKIANVLPEQIRETR